MEKLKFAFLFIGIGIVIGAVVVLALVLVFGAKPTKVDVGPIEFEMPTDTPALSTPTPELFVNTPVAAMPTPTPVSPAPVTPMPTLVRPTPASRVFFDDFDVGMSPSWRIESGDPIVVSGRLSGRDKARLTLDIPLPDGYSVELRTWPWESWWSRAWAGDMLYLCIESEGKILALGWGRFDFGWLVYEGGDWESVPGSYSEFDDAIEGGAKLRVRVFEGVYTLYVNGEQVSYIVDRRFSCNRLGFRFGEGTSFIDDFAVDKVTP